MKKLLLSILLLFLLIWFFKPEAVSSPLKNDLSFKDWNKYLTKAKNNDIESLLNLYLYYDDLYEDFNSSLMVICQGVNIRDKTFKSILKRRLEKNPNLICPKKPLSNLKYNSSYIPIEIRIFWLKL